MDESKDSPRLPPDLLHLLCQELADRLDFSTLYRCAISSKVFAANGALSSLYKICNDSPVRSGGNESLPIVEQFEQELVVQRWSILWRTITLSSLGHTLYPYCRYLKVLDLRDLADLLDDDKFRGKVANNFFSGELARFNSTTEASARIRGRLKKFTRLDIRSIVSALGDVITETSPMLEAINEPIILDVFTTALQVWPPRLRNLQFLQLGNGKALADPTIRELLCSSCPNLNKIDIYQWTHDATSDTLLAQFLLRLPENTLTYFENHSDCGIAGETCQALAYHAKSLRTLNLAVSSHGLPGLPALHPCTQLEALKLTDLRPPNHLKDTQNDVFLGIVAWLQQCTRLKDLSLIDFVSAPAILTPVLEKSIIQLEALQINSQTEDSMYFVKDNQDFHRALSKQQSLTSLSLKADAEATFGDDVQTVCDCICALSSLKDLKLTRITEYFSDRHVDELTEHLLDLEELLVEGYGITDASLRGLSRLRNLKSASFTGLTSFTANGLLDFIESLGLGSQGLVLSIDRAVAETALSEPELELVRTTLNAKVQGRLEYQTHKDLDISDFDQSDSE